MKFFAVAAAVCLAGSLPGAQLCAQKEDLSPAESYSEVQSALMLQDADSVLSVPYLLNGAPQLRWYSMFTNVPGDWVNMGERVFRPESIPALGGIALATGVLMAVDHLSYTYCHGIYTRSADVRFASNQFLRLGDGRTTLGIAAAFGVYGFIGDDGRALRTASGTVEAFIASGITVQLFKRIAGRESPQAATQPNGKWHPFPGIEVYNRHQSRYYAFPSGHITTLMSTVTVVSENYPDEHWIRPAGCALVGLTGVSLVNRGWHWYSDFPLAIAMGYTFGKIAAHHYDDTPEPAGGPGTTSLSVMPGITHEGAGVMLALRF